jgi:hypothetical protein
LIGRDVVIEATGSMRQVGAACGGRSTLLVDRLSSEVVPMIATRGVRLGVYSMLAAVWTSTGNGRVKLTHLGAKWARKSDPP